MELQHQRTYWDKVAYDKEFRTPLQMQLFSEYVSRKATVLDYGCGYGRILTELSDVGFKHLFGVDLSPVMIERARGNCPEATLQVSDGKKIPLAGNTVEAVILVAVLTSIPRDEDQRQLLGEIRRVLKPGGYLYINDFLLNDDDRNLQRYGEYLPRYAKYGVFELPDGGVQRHHDREYIKQLLSTFNQVAYEEMVYTTMNGHPASGFYYLGQSVI